MMSVRSDDNAQNSRMKVRHVFVSIYVLANIYAFALATAQGSIGGDFAGFPAPSVGAGLLLLGLICLAYLLVLFPLFNQLSSIVRLRQIAFGPIEARTQLHWGVLLLQLFLLIFALTTDIGTAGRIVKSESAFRFFTYFIPIDYIALIYLAIARNNVLYKANLIFYVVSNVLRGWSSIFLFLIFISICRSRRGLNLTPLRWLALGLFLLIALPLAFGLRFYFRDFGGDISDLSDLLPLLHSNPGEGGLDDLLGFVLSALFDRFQHFSSVAMEYMNQDQLRRLVFDGSIRIFLFDGSYFTALYVMLFGQAPFELNSMLIATFLGLDPAVDGYNTHSGLVGWLVLLPEFSPIFVAYLLGLGFVSIRMATQLRTRLAIDVTWLMWLILIMNGWFGGFVNYIVALFFVNALQLPFVRNPAAGMNMSSQHLATTKRLG